MKLLKAFLCWRACKKNCASCSESCSNMGCDFGVFCRPSGLLKIAQIAIGIILIGLYRGNNLKLGSGDTLDAQDREYMAIITMGGMLLVTIPMFVINFFGGGVENASLAILQNLTGCILYLITGILALEQYTSSNSADLKDPGVAFGALSLVNSLAYGLDTFFAWRSRSSP